MSTRSLLSYLELTTPTGKSKISQNNNVIRYCSDSCRKRRLGPLDKKIEKTILALLQGDSDSGIDQTAARRKLQKGDKRLIITCDEIENIVFDREPSPDLKQISSSKTSGTNDSIVNESDTHVDQGGRQVKSVEAEAIKRAKGQRRAEEREIVRRAARRAVVFGLAMESETSPDYENDLEAPVRRKCEAIMNGQVVEPSYAKGDWAIRWRESP